MEMVESCEQLPSSVQKEAAALEVARRRQEVLRRKIGERDGIQIRFGFKECSADEMNHAMTAYLGGRPGNVRLEDLDVDLSDQVNSPVRSND